jgi:glutathione S-transferase
MDHRLDLATSFLASAARLGAGMRVAHVGKRPERPLKLYEFEACPFCRKVREALSILDLETMVYPCPKNGRRFRSRVIELGGKAQFPYLDDPNTGRRMYESDDIIRYLAETYGDGTIPRPLALGKFTLTTAILASRARPGRGRYARASHSPAQPVELWSYEASPACRLVREAICELEIPYLLHTAAAGSAHLAQLRARGVRGVPFLFDPNADKAVSGAVDVVAHLESTYGGRPD